MYTFTQYKFISSSRRAPDALMQTEIVASFAAGVRTVLSPNNTVLPLQWREAQTLIFDTAHQHGDYLCLMSLC